MTSGRYGELAAKVDAFFGRVEARHGEEMACHTGCSDCCHVRLTITPVEATALRVHVTGLPAERRAELAANLARDPGRCAALDAGGRCLVYAARPIVCRSHGAPIRLRDERSLPVVQACFRNFTARGPATADADCILDQTTLSALVLATNREAGAPPTRSDLAALLAELTSTRA